MQLRWTGALLGALLALPARPASPPPGVVVDHQPASTSQYIGSPSIAILPSGVYVCSHDLFGPNSTENTSGVTRVFVSRDRGGTWQQTAELHDQFWSSLFVLHKNLYLLGITGQYGRIVIRRSSDAGATWSAPAYLTSDPGYHTAPVPVIVARGRVWRAFERHPAGAWGGFQAFLASAPEHADLLDPRNWTFSNRLPFPADASAGKTWLEGNAVLGPGHHILDILRVDNVEKAAIAELHDGTLKFSALVDFPGGAKKFTIRYDKRSRRYWALSNPALASEPLSATNPAMVRNTLALLSSADLHHWRVERIILSHPDPAHFAFQYVDWQFDGADIVAVSRTAFTDDTGGAHRAHDANFFTFHRIRDFRTASSLLFRRRESGGRQVTARLWPGFPTSAVSLEPCFAALLWHAGCHETEQRKP
jgi:hypothetical protein